MLRVWSSPLGNLHARALSDVQLDASAALSPNRPASGLKICIFA